MSFTEVATLILLVVCGFLLLIAAFTVALIAWDWTTDQAHKRTMRRLDYIERDVLPKGPRA